MELRTNKTKNMPLDSNKKWVDLTKQQRDIVKRKIKLRRIVGIFIPGLSLLWARSYKIRGIWIGLNHIFYNGIKDLESQNNEMLFLVIGVRFIITERALIYSYFPEWAFNNSKKMKKLILE